MLSSDILTVPPHKFALPHVSSIDGGKLKIMGLVWLLEALSFCKMTWVLVKGFNKILLFWVEGVRAQLKSDFGSTDSNGGY
jgi:hypothetical protein